MNCATCGKAVGEDSLLSDRGELICEPSQERADVSVGRRGPPSLRWVARTPAMLGSKQGSKKIASAPSASAPPLDAKIAPAARASLEEVESP